MRHCTPDELMDVADGVCAADAVPHLADCAECRAQVDELRLLTGEIASVPVPEPPAQFWSQLSERVHEAVAHEPRPRRSRLDWLRTLSSFSPGMNRRAAWPALATLAAAMILAVVFVPRQLANRPNVGRDDGANGSMTRAVATGSATPGDTSADAGVRGNIGAPGNDDRLVSDSAAASDAQSADASFMAFMGDLADGIDLDAAASAGLTPTGAVTDAAVTELTGDEQVELQRLIKEALAGAGV